MGINANSTAKLWKDFMFWKFPNQNLSKIFPKIFPKFGNFLNLSKGLKSFQTAILAGYRSAKSFQKSFLTRMRRRARVIYMEKNISLKGYIFFSNVNKFGKIKSFQKSTAKNCDAAPRPLAGRLAAIFPQGKRSAMIAYLA